MKVQAQYRLAGEFHLSEGLRVLAIIDKNDGSMSITNDAEAVVEELHRHGMIGPSVRLVYRDTEGRWDELMHENGRFIGFDFLAGVTSLNSVIDLLKRRATASRNTSEPIGRK